MVDVLRAYRFFETGQLSVMIGIDAPNKLVEAIEFFHSVLSRCHAKREELRAQEAANERRTHGLAAQRIRR